MAKATETTVDEYQARRAELVRRSKELRAERKALPDLMAAALETGDFDAVDAIKRRSVEGSREQFSTLRSLYELEVEHARKAYPELMDVANRHRDEVLPGLAAEVKAAQVKLAAAEGEQRRLRDSAQEARRDGSRAARSLDELLAEFARDIDNAWPTVRRSATFAG